MSDLLQGWLWEEIKMIPIDVETWPEWRRREFGEDKIEKIRELIAEHCMMHPRRELWLEEVGE